METRDELGSEQKGSSLHPFLHPPIPLLFLQREMSSKRNKKLRAENAASFFSRAVRRYKLNKMTEEEEGERDGKKRWWEDFHRIWLLPTTSEYAKSASNMFASQIK